MQPLNIYSAGEKVSKPLELISDLLWQECSLSNTKFFLVKAHNVSFEWWRCVNSKCAGFDWAVLEAPPCWITFPRVQTSWWHLCHSPRLSGTMHCTAEKPALICTSFGDDLKVAVLSETHTYFLQQQSYKQTICQHLNIWKCLLGNAAFV